MNISIEENFCRVFEMPESYPNKYCFGGGHDISIKMVDWFNPLPSDITCEISGLSMPNTWEEAKALLLPFLLEKKYVKRGRRYILITEFGESLVFHGG